MNVAIITAKGSNESIPNKNLIQINGKPIIEYVIDAAKSAELVDKVFVLSDAPQIQEKAMVCNCEVIVEPPYLTKPNVNHGAAIQYAVDTVKQIYPDLEIVTILLGNTVMVDEELINLSIATLNEFPEYDSVMSVWEAADDHPYRAMKLNGYFLESYDGSHGTARQYYPKVYYYDQGVWTFRADLVNKGGGPACWWWMGRKCYPIVRPWVTGRDIHSMLDIEMAEFWVKKNGGSAISV